MLRTTAPLRRLRRVLLRREHLQLRKCTAPPSNEYYFIGVVEHEITEDMGRFSLLNYQPSFYSVMDLYRYSSPGVRDLTTGGPGSTAYFSIDDGTTDLGSWNNEASNGDLGDWYGNNIPNGGDDAFDDYSPSGVVNIVSQSDITLMNALGWTSATGTPSPTVSYADVLWRNTDGTLAEWLMNGSTIVSDQPPTYQGTAVSPDASWNIVGIGDFRAMTSPTFCGSKVPPANWRIGS